MADAQVQIEGGPELRRALRALNADLTDLSGLHRQIAAYFVTVLSGTAPRDSGRLAGSFRPAGTRTKARARSSLVYSPVINYGWPDHGIEGQHYAEAALSASESTVHKMYRTGIEKLLRKAEA